MTNANTVFAGHVEHLADAAGVEWFDYQWEFFKWCDSRKIYTSEPRACLYYKTGAGKSITALVAAHLWGHEEVLVITPPSTYDAWVEQGNLLGIKVNCMSHAKFRMKDTKLDRDMMVIADEMHMFGGHSGQGWIKLNRLARGLKAPMVLASATPNYNDADRVFCIQSILDPASVKGGFLQFLYAHCKTEQNPFGMMPNVTGFQQFVDAANYLQDLPGVFYLPDDLTYTIQDHMLGGKISKSMTDFGYSQRKHKIMASLIEEKHTIIFEALVGSHGMLFDNVWWWVQDRINAAHPDKVLIFANHSTVADAAGYSLSQTGLTYSVITGKTGAKTKAAMLDAFRSGKTDVLVGTASLATGTDGLDKVCDTLLILDDTEDDSLRRQLIGRIMPRGSDTDASKKQVHRLVLQ